MYEKFPNSRCWLDVCQMSESINSSRWSTDRQPQDLNTEMMTRSKKKKIEKGSIVDGYPQSKLA